MDTHLNGKRKYLIFSHLISHSTAEPNTYHKLKLATEETYTLHFYTLKLLLRWVTEMFMMTAPIVGAGQELTSAWTQCVYSIMECGPVADFQFYWEGIYLDRQGAIFPRICVSNKRKLLPLLQRRTLDHTWRYKAKVKRHPCRQFPFHGSDCSDEFFCSILNYRYLD